MNSLDQLLRSIELCRDQELVIPSLMLTYNGCLGVVSLTADGDVETCYYCDEQRGREEALDVERHLREDLGERLRA